MNILDEANRIVNERSEEKERAYGSFSEGMKRAASIASGMTGKDITADDMFACMVALKFSRQSFNHKTDNLLDAVAYLGAWNNFIDEEAARNFPKSPKFPNQNDFKEKFESEVFPEDAVETFPEETQPWVKNLTEVTEVLLMTNEKLDKLTKYVEYLAEKTDQTITYAEYVGEQTSIIKDEVDAIRTILMPMKEYMSGGGGSSGPRP